MAVEGVLGTAACLGVLLGDGVEADDAGDGRTGLPTSAILFWGVSPRPAMGGGTRGDTDIAVIEAEWARYVRSGCNEGKDKTC